MRFADIFFFILEPTIRISLFFNLRIKRPFFGSVTNWVVSLVREQKRSGYTVWVMTLLPLVIFLVLKCYFLKTSWHIVLKLETASVCHLVRGISRVCQACFSFSFVRSWIKRESVEPELFSLYRIRTINRKPVSCIFVVMVRKGRIKTTHTLIVKNRAWSSRCCGLAFAVTLRVTLRVGVGNTRRY